MATIQISNLHPNGSALFSDDESYLKELSADDIELSAIQGGVLSLIAITYVSFAVAGGRLGYVVTIALQGRSV